MFEEIYFWNKNGRPDTAKNHDTNTLCHYKLRNVKTEGMIIKTCHLDCHSKNFQEKILDQDITPFVQYSMNKKKRWEARAGVDLLGELQKMYDGDVEVLILERVTMRHPFYIGKLYDHLFYYNLYFSRFPIRKIHTLQSDNSYHVTSVNSVIGQPIPNFAPENRLSSKTKSDDVITTEVTKLAYHIITPPRNYEIFSHKKFHPGRLRLKWWWPLDHVKMDFRPFIEEDLYEAITYDGLLDRDWDDVHEWDEEEEEDIGRDHPKEFYDLKDHFVDNWMFVKRRKNGKRVADGS